MDSPVVKILFALQWNLNPPTPLKFIAALMRFIPVWEEKDYPEHASYKDTFKAMFDISMYLTELSVMVSVFAFHSKNSTVAYASILCAMEALEDALPLPYEVRVRFLNNVAQATGMLPESEKVRSVRNLLLELCPSIGERDVSRLINPCEDEVEQEEEGHSSPVCVSHGVPDPHGCRKRNCA